MYNDDEYKFLAKIMSSYSIRIKKTRKGTIEGNPWALFNKHGRLNFLNALLKYKNRIEFKPYQSNLNYLKIKQ